jgi:hypothetical protein
VYFVVPATVYDGYIKEQPYEGDDTPEWIQIKDQFTQFVLKLDIEAGNAEQARSCQAF